jgi:WD40 repeat protein
VKLASAEQVDKFRSKPSTVLDTFEQFRNFLINQVAAIERAPDKQLFVAQQAHNAHASGVLHDKGAEALRASKSVVIARSWESGDLDNSRDPCIRMIPTASRALALAWNAGRDRLAIGQENGDVRILRFVEGQTEETEKILRASRSNSQVVSVDLSPDMKMLVAAHHDGSVRVYDVESEKCLWDFRGHDKGYRNEARLYYANAWRLVTAGADGNVHIWDIDAQNKVWSLPDANFASGLAVTEDGRRLVYGKADGTIACWNLLTNSREAIGKGHTEPVTSIAMSFDGRFGVTGDVGGSVRRWDLSDGACIDYFKVVRGAISSVAITPDGNRFAAAGTDKKIYVWSVGHTDCERMLCGSAFSIRRIALHPLGHSVVSAGREFFLRVWDVKERNSLPEEVSTGDEVTSLATARDGRHVFGSDEAGGLFKRRLPDLKPTERAKLLLQKSNQAPDFWGVLPLGKDDSICVVGLDQSIRIWDRSAKRIVKQFSGAASGKTFPVIATLDEKIIITTGGESSARVCLWDRSRGTCLQVRELHSGRVRGLAMFPDGRRFVSASEDRKIVVWRVDRPEPEAVISDAHPKHIHAIACSPDGRFLASAGQDRLVKIWNAKTRQCVGKLEGHQRALTSVAFSSDGRWIWSACWEGIVKIWDAGSGQEIASAWIPGTSKIALVNLGGSAAVGTTLGKVFRIDARGLEMGPAIATATPGRPSVLGSAARLICPCCQGTVALSKNVAQRITKQAGGDEGFNDEKLLISCKKCETKIRINPFWASLGVPVQNQLA